MQPLCRFGRFRHGPGFALAGLALLLFATIVAPPARVVAASDQRVPR